MSNRRTAEEACRDADYLLILMPRKLKGITETPTGFRAYIRVHGRLYAKRFPKNTSKTTMTDWRQAKRVDVLRESAKRAKHRPAPGTFAEDVETYLKAVRTMTTYETRKKDLDAWILTVGTDSRGHARKRSDITVDEIRATLHEWRLRGKPKVKYVRDRVTRKTLRVTVGHGPLSESACNHRRSALMHLYSVLDGQSAANPVREVPKFREPDPEPRGVPLEVLQRIFDAMPDTVTKARAQILAWTGLPPATLAQVKPESVNEAEMSVYVPRRRKGKGTKARVVPLLPPAVEAFQALARYDGFGPFSIDALRHSVHRACDRAGVPRIRAYDLRHSFGTAAYAASGDIRAVQSLLDHSDVKLTERYTLGAVDPRVRMTLSKLRKVAAKVTGGNKSK